MARRSKNRKDSNHQSPAPTNVPEGILREIWSSPRRHLYFWLLVAVLVFFAIWVSLTDRMKESAVAMLVRTVPAWTGVKPTVRIMDCAQGMVSDGAAGNPIGTPYRQGGAVQYFERGFMLWLRDDSDSVYVFVDQGGARSWRRYGHVTLNSNESQRLTALLSNRKFADDGFPRVWIRYKLDSTLGVPLVRNRNIVSHWQRYSQGKIVCGIPYFDRNVGGYDRLNRVVTLLLIHKTSENGTWELSNFAKPSAA